MASGMESSHRGFAGTVVQFLSAGSRRTFWRRRGRIREGDVGRNVAPHQTRVWSPA